MPDVKTIHRTTSIPSPSIGRRCCRLRAMQLATWLVIGLLALSMALDAHAQAPPSAPGGPASQHSSSSVVFDVLTYNVKMVGWPSNAKNKPRAKKMISQLGGARAKKSDNFDVIALQEAYGAVTNKILLKGPKSGLFKREGGLLNAYQYADHAAKNGLLVISNWPIVTEKWERFNNNPGLRARGVLYTEIDKKNAERNVHVFTTHLWWKKKCGRAEQDQSDRIAQLKQIDNFISSQNIPSGEPVFIIGDFNFGGPTKSAYNDCNDANVESYHQLKSYLHANQLTHVAHDDNTQQWPGTTNSGHTLDHIFHRNVGQDLDQSASFIERLSFTTTMDLGGPFKRRGSTHLSDHDPVRGHFVFDWDWEFEEPTTALPQAAKGWIGTYQGRNDGRRARLNIESRSDPARLAITFEDLDRNTKLTGTAYPSQFEGSPVHILEDLRLTNGECTTWSDGECVRKHIARLFLHNDADYISGYSAWNETHYGMAFSSNGVSSSVGSGGRFNTSQWTSEWTGTFRGRQDGRRAKLTIERDGSQLRLTLDDLERGLVFTGTAQNASQPRHTLDDITLTTTDGDVKHIERLLLHTWDTNYISGYSEWQGTDYGSYFVRVGAGSGSSADEGDLLPYRTYRQVRTAKELEAAYAAAQAIPDVQGVVQQTGMSSCPLGSPRCTADATFPLSRSALQDASYGGLSDTCVGQLNRLFEAIEGAESAAGLNSALDDFQRQRHETMERHQCTASVRSEATNTLSGAQADGAPSSGGLIDAAVEAVRTTIRTFHPETEREPAVWPRFGFVDDPQAMQTNARIAVLAEMGLRGFLTVVATTDAEAPLAAHAFDGAAYGSLLGALHEVHQAATDDHALKKPSPTTLTLMPRGGLFLSGVSGVEDVPGQAGASISGEPSAFTWGGSVAIGARDGPVNLRLTGLRTTGSLVSTTEGIEATPEPVRENMTLLTSDLIVRPIPRMGVQPYAIGGLGARRISVRRFDELPGGPQWTMAAQVGVGLDLRLGNVTLGVEVVDYLTGITGGSGGGLQHDAFAFLTLGVPIF